MSFPLITTTNIFGLIFKNLFGYVYLTFFPLKVYLFILWTRPILESSRDF